MSQQTIIPDLPRGNQLLELENALVKARTLIGSPKNYARLAIEDPHAALEVLSAAEALAPLLRAIRNFG